MSEIDIRKDPKIRRIVAFENLLSERRSKLKREEVSKEKLKEIRIKLNKDMDEYEKEYAQKNEGKKDCWADGGKGFLEGGIPKQEIEYEELLTEEFLLYKKDKEGELILQNGKPQFDKVNIDKVAEHLINKHNFVTWFGVKSDYSYNYNGKIFEKNARGIIKTECERLLNVYCKRNVVDEVFEKIKRKTAIDKEEFETTDTNLICLENGVFDIKERKLKPHNPEYKFQTLIPINYNPEAKPKKWMKFLEEALYPEDIPVIQEWFGFNLYRRYFIKKGLIFLGDTDTGKTVLMNTITKFIGEKNKTGLSLQKISNGTDFNRLDLKGKHSNIFDDLESGDINNGGVLKVATGGGYISGEEKFGEYHQFKSFAKLLFAANKIPPVRDNDDKAYFGRWIIINFDNVPEKKDPFLTDKLTTKEELSGILNWSLEGLYRLLENGEFSYKKTPEEVKKMMERSGVPLVAFKDECLEKKNGNFVTKELMYQVYLKWCEKNDRPVLTKEKLGRELPKHAKYVLDAKQKERGWSNVEFKESWKKVSEVSKNLLGSKKKDSTDTSSKHICPEKKEDIHDSNTVDISSSEVSEASKPKPTLTTTQKPLFTRKRVELASSFYKKRLVKQNKPRDDYKLLMDGNDAERVS